MCYAKILVILLILFGHTFCSPLYKLKNNYNIAFAIRESRMIFKGNRIVADLAASQAILESNLYGVPSKLAIEDNNLFGIKGFGTAGSVVYHTTECNKRHCYRVAARFAKNASVADSFTQYARILCNSSRYRNIFTAKTVEEAAFYIQKDGYATDPHYAHLILSVYYQYVKNS